MYLVACISVPSDRGQVRVDIINHEPDHSGTTVYKIDPVQNVWSEREAAALRMALRAADLLVNQ